MATSILKPTTGKTMTVNRIGGLASQAAVTFMGFGSDGTVPVAGDTALHAEFSYGTYQRAVCVITRTAADTLQWQGTIAAPGPGALVVSELGLFDATVAGGLYARATFTSYTLNGGDNLQLTVTEQQL